VQLFHSLKSHAPGDSEWDDLVAFLQEFCSLAKHLQLQHRQNLWNKMTQLGMFEVRRPVLAGGKALCTAVGGLVDSNHSLWRRVRQVANRVSWQQSTYSGLQALMCSFRPRAQAGL
jgi:hypothetical protein